MQNREINIESPSPAVTYGILVVVAGLILPAVLIPIVKLTGYSEIVEEIVKALAVLFLILKLPTRKMQVFFGVCFGLLFGVSENFLYLNQIFQLGNFHTLWLRFLWTIPMHIVTVLVILFFGQIGKKFIIFGLISAIILHLLFNSSMVQTIILNAILPSNYLQKG